MKVEKHIFAKAYSSLISLCISCISERKITSPSYNQKKSTKIIVNKIQHTMLPHVDLMMMITLLFQNDTVLWYVRTRELTLWLCYANSSTFVGFLYTDVQFVELSRWRQEFHYNLINPYSKCFSKFAGKWQCRFVDNIVVQTFSQVSSMCTWKLYPPPNLHFYFTILQTLA